MVLYFLKLKRFSGLFRFRFLPPGADSLPNHPEDCFGAAVSAVDLGVHRVRESCTCSQMV